MKYAIAVDLGASSGKMAIGHLEKDKLVIDEYRNFVNRPVDIGTALYWDVFSLYHSVLDGLMFFKKYDGTKTVGIDTWGATFGLLDAKGRLLEPVYHYRDRRTVDVMEKLYKNIDAKMLFQWTGCQCNRTYTLPQLYEYVIEQNPILKFTSKLLLLPDLLGYFLTGNALTETTIAGTTGLLEKSMDKWSERVIEKYELPRTIFGTLEHSGVSKGRLRKDVIVDTGADMEVLTVAEHDSASAVLAIPKLKEGDLYISIGTNISMGVETSKANTSDPAFYSGLKNTAGFGGRTIIYRDFSACWHLNEFIRTCRGEGKNYSFEQIVGMAEEDACTGPWIDVEDPDLCKAGGNYKEQINLFLSRTNQKGISEDYEFVNCIHQSIAMKVKHYKEAFQEIGFSCGSIYAISGGTNNKKLMQCISDVLGEELNAGIPYASLNGNLLAQIYVQEGMTEIHELRGIAENSFELRKYLPRNRQDWHENYLKYEEIMRHSAL